MKWYHIVLAIGLTLVVACFATALAAIWTVDPSVSNRLAGTAVVLGVAGFFTTLVGGVWSEG